MDDIDEVGALETGAAAEGLTDALRPEPPPPAGMAVDEALLGIEEVSVVQEQQQQAPPLQAASGKRTDLGRPGHVH